MQILTRTIQQTILSELRPGKVIVIVGARRIGKTVLLNQILEQIDESPLLIHGEDFTIQKMLQNRSTANYVNFLDGKRLLVIDEAQKIPEVGKILKLMVDTIADLRVIITGSSAFDLAHYTGEPLTGRKLTFQLFPLSEKELSQIENRIEKPDNLRHRLVYGNYPELLHLQDNEFRVRYLRDMLQSYLLKDILAFENIKNSDKIFDLLRLLAFQVGGEVSQNELGRQLGMSKETVDKYLDLLSKVFIIHRVGGFSRNLRKEVSKSNKWYFYDNGIRNTLISNDNPIELRNDTGQLWENYIISERIKAQHYGNMLVNNFFWRTYDQQEIDWIEERGGKLYAYEIKWSQKKRTKVPTAWAKHYPDASFQVIHQDNYLDWLDLRI